MAIVFDLDQVEGVWRDFDRDLGRGGVERVVEELFDECEGVGKDLAGAEGADGGGGEGLDWHGLFSAEVRGGSESWRIR